MSFIAAVVQDSPEVFNLSGTIDKVEQLAKKAKNKGAENLVFPEAFVSSYPKGNRFWS